MSGSRVAPDTGDALRRGADRGAGHDRAARGAARRPAPVPCWDAATALAEEGRLLTVPWRAPVGLSSTTTSVLTGSGAVVRHRPAEGGPALRVTVGGRSVVGPDRVRPVPQAGPDAAAQGGQGEGEAGQADRARRARSQAAGRKLPGSPVTVQRYARAKQALGDGRHGAAPIPRGATRRSSGRRARGPGPTARRCRGTRAAAGWKRGSVVEHDGDGREAPPPLIARALAGRWER